MPLVALPGCVTGAGRMDQHIKQNRIFIACRFGTCLVFACDPVTCVALQNNRQRHQAKCDQNRPKTKGGTKCPELCGQIDKHRRQQEPDPDQDRHPDNRKDRQLYGGGLCDFSDRFNKLIDHLRSRPPTSMPMPNVTATEVSGRSRT